jgi:hypothetical protein
VAGYDLRVRASTVGTLERVLSALRAGISIIKCVYKVGHIVLCGENIRASLLDDDDDPGVRGSESSPILCLTGDMNLERGSGQDGFVDAI